MEIVKSKAVKLRSHLDKYLVADADCLTVRQSRNSATHRRSVWLVEPSSAVSGAVRLRNQDTGLYLTASDAPFLLGMTGRKVIQSSLKEADGKGSVDWKAERDGFQMRLRTAVNGEGKFLRANGGMPPWRNSITHDLPVSGPTSNWTLWDLEPVEVEEEELCDSGKVLSPATSFAGSEISSFEDLLASDSFRASPTHTASAIKSGMDFFANAKSVRLRSHHDKYLNAGGDETSVTQHRTASSRTTCWTVELVPSSAIIRLKSCHGKYLSASNHPFLLGMTGCKVLQTLCLDSSVQWEPVADGGGRVKLRAVSTGTFLRANGGLPPWRNSVTHDVPHRAATLDWVLWDVHVIEASNGPVHLNAPPMIAPMTPPPLPPIKHPAVQPCRTADSDSFSSETSLSSSSSRANECSRQESSDSMVFHSPPRLGGKGRVIYYQIVDDHGNVSDENAQGYSLNFNGSDVKELASKLEKYTGIKDIIVCTRSPLDGKLCPLRLQLPPNTFPMNLVVVPSSSLAGTNLERMSVLR